MREVGKLNGLSVAFDRLAQALKQHERAETDGPQAVGERAEQLREEQIHQIFDELAIGISLMDAEYRVVGVSAAMADMVGYSANELRGKRFSEFMKPEDVDV